MSYDQLWQGPARRLRSTALSLMVNELEYEHLDEVLGRIIILLRREQEMLPGRQPGPDSRHAAAQRFADSITLLQEDFALLVADWKDGMAHEAFVKRLEEYKIRWFRQLPK